MIQTFTVSNLSRHGARPALITRDEIMTYTELAARVGEAGGLLAGEKRLVAIAGTNTTESLVAYLAAMAHGHAVLLAPGDSPVHLGSIVDTYDPDIVFGAEPGGGFVERRPGSRHRLHPDLALLMSTSGSTGSPKLVRLSHRNIVSNARSIADYLSITEDDRAITTLPMHYCYGLSVVNSHLLSGAGLVVTDWSVVDPCLWDLADDAGATSFAGVPYTFDLLDSTDFADRELPSLRYITQAGGHFAPDRVAQYARLGQARGWQFFTMYGQTEATARMAYLPPELATTRPDILGVPVPGGSFRLEAVPESSDPAVGELVYAGPNVMMGYAAAPGDLADGATVEELRTGDLVRRLPDGAYQLVGRRGRRAKIFGLRIDLDEVERIAIGAGVPARCVSVGDRLQIFVTPDVDASRARAVVAGGCGLPEHVVSVGVVREQPYTGSGKIDYTSLARQAQILERTVDRGRPRAGVAGPDAIRDLFAELLGRPEATIDDSFRSLGGDSLSYVELSVRLQEAGVGLPPDWHRHTVRDLAGSAQRAGPRGVRLDTSIVLRAAAILLILGTHANLWTVPGGAHVLLAVVGFNFARFQLTDAPGRQRLRAGLASIGRLALPCMVWIGAVAAIFGTYRPQTVLFLNGLGGSEEWTDDWQFWFLEAIIWTQVVVVVLLSIPWLRRAERRAPFVFACAVLAGSSIGRYVLVGVEAGATERYTPSVVLWCFALGWCLAAATSTRQRLLVSIAAVVSVIGFFGDPARETVVAAGILILAWVPSWYLPSVVARVVAAIAAASLYIYVTQWQVYPHLEERVPVLAVLASITVAIAYRHLWEWLSAVARAPGSRWRRAGVVDRDPRLVDSST